MRKNKMALALAGAAGLCMSAAAYGQSDSCATATVISNGTFAYDLTGATNEGNTAGACGLGATAQDLWWSYTATGDGSLTIATCGFTASDTALSLWSDCGGTLTCPSSIETAPMNSSSDLRSPLFSGVQAMN